MNGGASTLVDQPDTGGGQVVLSVPVQLNLNNGANSITFGAGQTSEWCFRFSARALHMFYRVAGGGGGALSF